MWPTNRSFSYNVNGSYKLPARSRATAFISIGQWNQNEALVSPTVNTALTLLAPPLERPTAEAKADIVSMVYNFNSRPNDYVWLNAKYRYYDYANKTPLFRAHALVGDWAPGTAVWENEPSSMKRHTIDLDASVSAHKYVGFGMGFTREDSDRTYRIFEKTAEDTYRVSVDSTGNQYVTLRAKFEHSNREGSGFEAALLEEVGEQPDTRHYDIANRTRDRLTTTLTITPTAFLDVNASVSTGKDKYGQTGFGLRNNDNRTWSLGADVLPSETVNLGVNYGRESLHGPAALRTANPLTVTDVTFNDPTRDWWTDQADTVKTFSASADFLKCLPEDGYPPRVRPQRRQRDLRLQHEAGTEGVHDGAADAARAAQEQADRRPVRRAAILCARTSRLAAHTPSKDYKVRRRRPEQHDPQRAGPGQRQQRRVCQLRVLSGYLYHNYRAHTGWVRLTYLW